MVLFNRVSHIVGTGFLALSLIACGADTRGTDAGPGVDSGTNPPLTDSGTNTGGDSGPGTDGGGLVPFDSGFVGFDAGPGGSTAMSYTETIDGASCFTLATGVVNTNTVCMADLEFTAGINIDLWSSNFNAGAGAYCPTGVANSLAEVPSDYSTCSWGASVDGSSGITNQGFIVRDFNGDHHYRFHVQSNNETTLIFSYDMID